MHYTDMFKRKMVQKLTGPNAQSALALSKQVDVSQTTLSRWLRKAGLETCSNIQTNTQNTLQKRQPVTPKSPNTWTPEEKLKTVLEAATLSDEQLGAFLRSKGLHETHLTQWRLQMLNGLGKQHPSPKTKKNISDSRQIKVLEKELLRKDKALAETAALLVLKKKAQEIWGDGDDNTSIKNGH